MQLEFRPCGRKSITVPVFGTGRVDFLYLTDYFYVLSESHPTETEGNFSRNVSNCRMTEKIFKSLLNILQKQILFQN